MYTVCGVVNGKVDLLWPEIKTLEEAITNKETEWEGWSDSNLFIVVNSKVEQGDDISSFVTIE